MKQQEKKTEKSDWILDLVVSVWFISVGLFFSVALLT